jgi:hypothetical protein
MRSRFATLSLALFLLSSGVAFGAAKKHTKKTTASHAHKTHHAMKHTKKAKK